MMTATLNSYRAPMQRASHGMFFDLYLALQ